MTAIPGLLAAFVAGAALGLLYLLLLWHSLRLLMRQHRAVLAFIAGLILRIAMVLLGLYATLQLGDWRHAATALAGFAMVRWLVTRRVTADRTRPAREGG